jgi:hypothetical protein
VRGSLSTSTIRRVSLTLALGSVAVALAIAARILRYPENHVGWDPRYALPIPIAGTLAALFACYRGARTHAVLALFGVAVAALLIAAVQLNWLVPYELWLSRGQPTRPF